MLFWGKFFTDMSRTCIYSYTSVFLKCRLFFIPYKSCRVFKIQFNSHIFLRNFSTSPSGGESCFLRAPFLKKCLFIYFERERERERTQVGEGQRGRERENPKQGSALSAQSLTWGSIPRTVRSWPKLKPRVRCLTDWVTQAPLLGAPVMLMGTHTNMQTNHIFLFLELISWSII